MKNKIKHLLNLSLSCILLFFVFTNILAENPYYPPSIQKILNKKTLVVALTKADLPPFFETNKQGKLHGLDITLAKKIAKSLGVNLKFNRKAKTFEQIIDIVAKNRADIAICNLSRTLWRAKKIFYTDPYIRMYHGILFNRLWLAEHKQNISYTANAIDLLKKGYGIIAVMKGTSYVNVSKKVFPKATFKYYTTLTEMYTAAENGEVNAIFDNDFQLKISLLDHPATALNFKIVILRNEPDTIAMAISHSKPGLREWINLFLETHHIYYNSDALIKYLVENYRKKPLN